MLTHTMLDRGSDMSAHVMSECSCYIINFNKLVEEKIKYEACWAFYHFFAIRLINTIQEHRDTKII